MWNFLKSSARKERDRIKSDIVKQEEISKKLEDDRLHALYLIESERLNDKIFEEKTNYEIQENKRVKHENETCPKCKSNKVVDKICQLKGNIEASSSSTNLPNFISSSSISGSIDTVEINKCNECNNEWKKITYNKADISWDSKMRSLRKMLIPTTEFPTKEYLNEIEITKEFWIGTKIEILPLLIENENFGRNNVGYEGNFAKESTIQLIKGKDEFLIELLGFIK